jgi:hypothetical protein
MQQIGKSSVDFYAGLYGVMSQTREIFRVNVEAYSILCIPDYTRCILYHKKKNGTYNL